MNETKRIYSINLCAYIKTVTMLTESQYWDDETHTYYWTFPECTAVKAAIAEYRKGNPTVRLNDFLRSIKMLRVRMHPVGGENDVAS